MDSPELKALRAEWRNWLGKYYERSSRSPTVPHQSGEDTGRTCAGAFTFNNDLDVLIPSQRRCRACGRQESYEPNVVLVVSRPSVPEHDFLQFSRHILEASSPGATKTDEELAVEVQLKSIEGRGIYTALVFYESSGCKTDPYDFFEGIFKTEEFASVVGGVYRKPIMTNRGGEREPY